MFCGKCGKKIEDGVKICPYCGNSVEASGQSWSSAPAGPEIMPDNNKKRGFAILAAVGCVAVIAIIAAVVLFGGFFSGPKGTLTKAVTKSVNAVQAASQSVGLPDWKKLTEDRKATQELSLRVESIAEELGYYSSELFLLEGLGFSMAEGVNVPDHKMDVSFAVTYGDTDVLSAWMDVDDAVIALGCPDFLGDRVFGFNSETVGQDLASLGAAPENVASISFNIFDALESFSQTVEVDKSARKELTDAIEVEKTGKSAIDVNGYYRDCTGYHVTIPEDAMRTYLDAVEAAYSARGLDNAFLDLLVSLGVSAAEVDEMRGEMKDAFSGKAVFDALDEAIAENGGLELEVFVSDGYISVVEWDGGVQNEDLSLRVCLGGGGNYADDWSAELKADGDRITVSSTGDHTASSGTYTDETSVTIYSGESIKITTNTSWEPKANDQNFQWSLKTSGVALTVSGQLTAGKDSMSLEMDKLAVNALGTDFVTLSGSYSIRPYAAPSYSGKTPSMLADLSEDDLLELYQDVIINSQEWVLDLGNRIPGLAQYFW